MHYKKEDVERALQCSSLLPEPGDEIVRKFAQDWLQMYERLPFKTQLELWPPPNEEIACPMCPGATCTLCQGSGRTTRQALVSWTLGKRPNPFEPK